MTAGTTPGRRRPPERVHEVDAGGMALEAHGLSAEDFAKEPHRNKISVLLSRNSHLAFHHGQMVLAEARR